MKYFAVASLLTLVLTFAVHSSATITINGENAAHLIQSFPEGNFLKCLPNKEGGKDNVCLRINKGTIEITPVVIDRLEEVRIPLRFDAIKKSNDRLSRSEKLRSFREIVDLSISFKDREISEKEEVYLEAGMDMKLENVILRSPAVLLAAKQLNFKNCFCGPKRLLIMSANPNSLYKSIVFTFDKKSLSHKPISGKIDFETDTGELKIFGVKEINFVFSEHALK